MLTGYIDLPQANLKGHFISRGSSSTSVSAGSVRLTLGGDASILINYDPVGKGHGYSTDVRSSMFDPFLQSPPVHTAPQQAAQLKKFMKLASLFSILNYWAKILSARQSCVFSYSICVQEYSILIQQASGGPNIGFGANETLDLSQYKSARCVCM